MLLIFSLGRNSSRVHGNQSSHIDIRKRNASYLYPHIGSACHMNNVYVRTFSRQERDFYVKSQSDVSELQAFATSPTPLTPTPPTPPTPIYQFD
jgi:hypothetical protein